MVVSGLVGWFCSRVLGWWFSRLVSLCMVWEVCDMFFSVWFVCCSIGEFLFRFLCSEVVVWVSLLVVCCRLVSSGELGVMSFL